MSKWTFGVLLLGFCFVGTLTFAQKAADKQPESYCEATTEDYAVYTAIIHDLGGPEDPEEAWQGKELLITDQTAAYELKEGQIGMWGFHSKSTAAPSGATVADFKAKSNHLCAIKPFENSELIDHVVLNKYFQKGHDGWEKFYKQHPKAAGYWDFSLSGHNSAGDEALVYVGHHCGWLCGTGHLYLLKKQDGNWKVINRLMLWIS